MFSKKNFDDAVSPVVGVILMVAVTVILAAVIGSFVLDLGNNVQANPQAGVTFSEDADEQEVSVQVISMENADDLSIQTDADAGDGFTASGTAQVGDTATIDTSGALTGSVTVVGHLDGKQAVLQTYDYDHSA